MFCLKVSYDAHFQVHAIILGACKKMLTCFIFVILAIAAIYLLPVSSRPRPPLSSHMPEQAPPTITAVLGAWLREVTV